MNIIIDLASYAPWFVAATLIVVFSFAVAALALAAHMVLLFLHHWFGKPDIH